MLLTIDSHVIQASESQASTMSGNLGVQDDASQEGEGLSVGGPGEVSAVEEEKRVSAQLESRVAALEQELRDKEDQQQVQRGIWCICWYGIVLL